VTLAPQVVQYDTVTGVPSEFNQYLPKDCEEYKRWAAGLIRALSAGALTRVGLQQTLLYQQVYIKSLMLMQPPRQVCAWLLCDIGGLRTVTAVRFLLRPLERFARQLVAACGLD